MKNFIKGIIFILLFAFMPTANTFAAPNISISISPQTVLLGGQAVYTVTISNTGPDKGYNLSCGSIFGSSLTDPDGQITFVSATDANGALAFSSQALDATTGDRSINFDNVQDLSPGEMYTMTLVVDLGGDATWEAFDDLILDMDASVTEFPDGSGTVTTGSEHNEADVLPIALVEKRVLQSTNDEQATGTLDHPYSYAIDVENNLVNPTDNVVITDTIPDGIEFLGVTSGHSCADSRDPASGITTVVCNLGTLAASAVEAIEYDAGIRYDFYGTDNGGTNRDHDDFDGTPATGIPIPDKLGLTNTVDMDAQYLGTDLPTQSDNATVTAAYATISKTSNVTEGENADSIDYTLTYTASEYYDILDDNIDDDSSSLTIHDLLPDGVAYVTSPAPSPAPTSVTPNANGTTDIYWNSSVLSGAPVGTSVVVTFSGEVNVNYNGTDPVLAGDNFANTADTTGEWDDQIDPARPDGDTSSTSSVGFEIYTPDIIKEVEDPLNLGAWLSTTDAVVGDELKFRIRYNTTDGTTPTYSSIYPGSVRVTDWLPPGTSYVAASASESFSDAAHFTVGGDPSTVSTVSAGALSGIEWFLGDILPGGWWEAEFLAIVDDVPNVTDEGQVNNLWKLNGTTSDGSEYSERDEVPITFREPILELDKAISDLPTPPAPGVPVEYTVTIENTGSATARDVLFTDTIANYMGDTTPTFVSATLDATTLTVGTDFLAPTYNSGTRAFIIDFNDGASTTDIPAGSTLTIVYTATPDADIGAGRRLRNRATVAYNSQSDGSGRPVDGTSSDGDENTDSAFFDLPGATLEKTAPAGPIKIGETVSYSLQITVPEGQILHWPDITDVFDRDGVSYVTGSAALTDVSGTPTTVAAFDTTTDPDPTITTAGADQTTLEWLLETSIDNSTQPTDYVFTLTYDVIYTGLEDDGTTWEFFPPTAADELDNTATLAWDSRPRNSRSTNQDDEDSDNVAVGQPLLESVKTVLSSGPYEAGSAVSYQVIVTNNGTSPAYDISWEDQMPTALGSPLLTSVTHNVAGALATGVGFLEDFSSNPLMIDFDGGSTDTNLLPGESVTIVYGATIENNITAGSGIANTIDVDWSSGDDTVDDERDYDDSTPEDDYTDDGSEQTIEVAGAIIDKSITSPTGGTVSIGDLISYRLRFTIPAETVVLSPSITDIISTDGLVYEAGSLAVTAVSGTPEAGAAISAAPTINTTSPNPGTTIEFAFDTDIDNANPAAGVGDTSYVFDVTYQVRATAVDDAGNWMTTPTGGFATDNTATFSWSDGTESYDDEDDATIDVEQPHLTLEKNFDVEDVMGGDTVEATVVITNTGDGTAYEYDAGPDFTDTMPAGLTNPQIVSVTHSANGLVSDPADYIFSVVGGDDFTLEYESALMNLGAGETLTILYTVDVEAGIGSGVNISNSADVDYSSSDSTDDSEIVFDDSNPDEGTDDEDTDNVTTAQATFEKTTTATALTATIGEEFDYVLTATIPEDTTIYNAEISDVVPDGLTVVSAVASPNVGSIITSPEVSGTTDVTWSAGDIAHTTSPTATLTITVRVDDAFDDGTLLDGLPVAADADGQDTLQNEGTFTWEDADTGGTEFSEDDDVTVTIIEPSPSIAKLVNTATGANGDTRQYTATLSNSADATADLQNIDFSDTLHADLFAAGSSPTIVSVTHSTSGVLASGTDYTPNLGTNPVTIDFSQAVSIAPSETITITYDVIIAESVSNGAVLDNTAVFTGGTEDAIDDTDGNGRDYTGSSGQTVTVAVTSLGDYVWFDLNKNGIQDGGLEVGIPGVIAHLETSAGVPVDEPTNPGIPYTVTTSSTGAYLFANMASGDYRVRFELPTGYLFSPQAATGDTTDSDVNAAGISETVTIVPGDHHTFLDAGIYGASISNLVWHDLDGDGEQDLGEPNISGVTVHLLDAGENPVDDPFNAGTPYITTTNSLGEYIFEHLAEGDYTVKFDTPSGYYPSPQGTSGDDATDSDADPGTLTISIINLGAGENDESVDQGFYIIHSIGNRVFLDIDDSGIDESEDGIPAVDVELRDSTGTTVLSATTTDAQGYYLFTNLPPGDYTVFLPEQPSLASLVSSTTTGMTSSDDDLDDNGDFVVGGWLSSLIEITTTSEPQTESGSDGSLEDPANDDNSNITVDFGFIDLSLATIVLTKSVYEGHDSGGGCGTVRAVDELVIVDEDGGDHDLTYCFIVNNVGPLRVGNITLEDETLSITEADMTLLSGSEPIEFSEQLVFYYETDSNTSIENSASATSYPVDTSNTPIGTDPVEDVDEALIIYVIDPPIGEKVGVLNGNDQISWTMTWYNDSAYTANNVMILDEIPLNTEYIDGSLSCVGNGSTVVNGCVYYLPDAAYPQGRVEVIADIGSDLGATSAAEVSNSLEITFNVQIIATGSVTIENQGELSWDPDSNGENDFTGILTDDPAIGGIVDPSVITTTIDTGKLDIEKQGYRPENLIITCTPQDNTLITWDDKAKGENGYALERKDNGGPWEIIALLKKNTESYEDTTLSPGSHYAYRVSAFHGDDHTPYSIAAEFTVPSGPAPSVLTEHETELFESAPSDGETNLDLVEVNDNQELEVVGKLLGTADDGNGGENTKDAEKIEQINKNIDNQTLCEEVSWIWWVLGIVTLVVILYMFPGYLVITLTTLVALALWWFIDRCHMSYWPPMVVFAISLYATYKHYSKRM